MARHGASAGDAEGSSVVGAGAGHLLRADQVAPRRSSRLAALGGVEGGPHHRAGQQDGKGQRPGEVGPERRGSVRLCNVRLRCDYVAPAEGDGGNYGGGLDVAFDNTLVDPKG